MLAVLSLVAGLGCGSTDAAPTEPPAAPATPAGLAASASSSGSIAVSWNASTGATAYKVQRAPDASGAPGTWGASTTVTSSPLADSGLAASTTYWYRVAASSSVGDSPFASPVSATTQATGGGGTVTAIPAALSALSTKRIVFAHASVGSNIKAGIETILDGNAAPKPSFVSFTYPTVSPGALTAGKIGEVAWGDALNQRPFEKVAAFQSFMNGGGMGAVSDIAMMKFCFVDFDAGPTSVETTARAAELFAAYQSMVSAVQAAHSGVKLVHFTSAITQADNTRREAYNNLIRSAYASTGRLFDLADIESNGHTDSFGRILDPALAVDKNDDHLNPTGKGVVAQALLLFLANLP
jgi:hypothetical protein